MITTKYSFVPLELEVQLKTKIDEWKEANGEGFVVVSGSYILDNEFTSNELSTIQEMTNDYIPYSLQIQDNTFRLVGFCLKYDYPTQIDSELEAAMTNLGVQIFESANEYLEYIKTL